MGTVLTFNKQTPAAEVMQRQLGRLFLMAAVAEDFGHRPVIRPKAKPAPKLKAGRNDPCPCGSGRKFKHCHHPQAAKLAEQQSRDQARAAEVAAAQQLEAGS